MDRARALVKKCALLATAVCLAIVASVVNGDSSEATGIRGTVAWGPVLPGPTGAGRSDEEPLRARFLVYQGERKVARFESGDDGVFELALPPGEYLVVPDAATPIPRPAAQQTAVTVPDDGYADVTISLDTGMR